MAEGRFDIGGTFTEGYESSMLNESEGSACELREGGAYPPPALAVLARQMYSGRKWFLARYPQLTDAAVVAFHQVRGQ